MSVSGQLEDWFLEGQHVNDHTIILPDPTTGEAVTLHVPEECPYFERCDSAFISEQPKINWHFCAFGFKFRLDDSLVHERWFSDRFSIIAAVAVSWFGESMDAICGQWKNREPTDEEKQRVIALMEQFGNWRRFTAKPKSNG